MTTVEKLLDHMKQQRIHKLIIYQETRYETYRSNGQ